MGGLNSVNIRPGVTILSVLKHLNYKTYYALAEFIDNAIDSFLKNSEKLKKLEGKDYILHVEITLDSNNNRISIKDNAAGIYLSDFSRAFRTAELPPDNTKLSEFGMGMKSAACWFSDRWQVKTKAIGENIERLVSLDITKIVEDNIEELDIQTRTKSLDLHYTEITLLDVNEKMPIKRGLGKVKRHLASIYRDFINKGLLKLSINKDVLKYESPKILDAPYYDDVKGQSIHWKQEVDFNFGDDGNGGVLKAKGFIAIMETMSVKDSGFALFRRGRVIEGSADNDEGFRPSLLSGSLGSHRYKRLFGELHLEGFKVSHTKDGFQWDDNMDAFLEIFKEELEKKDSLPILKQADKYRVRESRKKLETVSKKVVDNTTKKIQEHISDEIDTITSKEKTSSTQEDKLVVVQKSYFKKFPLCISNIDYIVHIELSYDESINELFQVGDHLIPEETPNYKNIGVRLSLIHPFMIQFAGDNDKIIEPILRIAVALGLSEIIAKKINAPISEVRKNINELLNGILSKQ